MLRLSFDIDIYLPFAVATYPAGATFGPRRLHNWEFVWMIEGDAEYRRADRRVDAPEGSLVLCQPGATDFFRWDPRRRTRHAYFHFDVHGGFPPDWQPPSTWPLVRIPSGEGDLMRPLFRHLLATPGGGDAVQTKLLALSLLAAFATGQTAGSGIDRPQYPEPVQRVLAYIAAQLDEAPAAPLPLSDLARAACVTPEYLCRLFKSATGASPAETVRRARLERAALLLARTNYSVAEVAALCGFESPFHFSRLFRRVYGTPPSELRRSLADGATMPNPHSPRHKSEPIS